ncbi:uncharacterized protein [Anabrus simplex]|uniref:uncharacterized protein isoform X2 n=1 Tax=Anabrus simplex TaxID=316456 RepID=UPI0035A309C1
MNSSPLHQHVRQIASQQQQHASPPQPPLVPSYGNVEQGEADVLLSSPPCPYRLQVGRTVTRYQSCTVDPRPGRAVHCPDLNACLVNEGRPEAVDCQAVHFGYAIPVTVVPLPEQPDLAELVLDPTPDLTPEAVSYLLRHHPQLRSENIQHSINGGTVTIVSNEDDTNMAATAKHETLRGRGNKFSSEPEEDIAAIAKQISDHAEAIYQTWKSRGLAPTEILTCHSNATAADKFGSALTPQQQQQTPTTTGTSSSASSSPMKQQRQQQSKKSPTPVVDLLTPNLDTNNLEQLVNNFVSEDKARIAAARQKSQQQHQQQQQQQQSKILPSSIQFALQKFEKQTPNVKNSPSNISYNKQSPVITPSESPIKTQASPSKTPASPSSVKSGQFSQSPHHSRTPSIPSSTSASPILKTTTTTTIPFTSDTIETIFPADLNVSKQQPKKVIENTENNATSGLTTWPLKNKTISGGNVTDRRAAKPGDNPTAITTERKAEDSSGKFATMPSNNKTNINVNNNKNSAYLEEVAREEERLINALKTGIIIAEEPSSTKTSGISPVEKKSTIVTKKTNKDKANSSSAKKEKKTVQSPPQQQGDVVVSPTGNGNSVSPKTSSAVTPKTSLTTQQQQQQQSNVIMNSVAPVVSPTVGNAASSPVKTTAVVEVHKEQQQDLDKSSLSNLSLVDYAKVRYRNAQQHPLTQQRLDDVKQLKVSSGGVHQAEKHGQQEVVSVAKNRFQLSPRNNVTNNSTGAGWRYSDQSGSGSSSDEGGGGSNKRFGGIASTASTSARGRLEAVPHPELTTQQRQHIRAAAAAAAANLPAGGSSGNNPVRPFLTRGSVAERVLIFEKCPTELMLDKRPGRSSPAITTWRTGHDVHAKAQTYGRSKENVRPSLQQPNTTLQRHVKANRNVHIPKFYFPKGKPNAEQQDTTLQKIAAAFRQDPNQQVSRDQFHTITKACDCPLYWKVPLFIAAGGEKLGYVEANSFIEFWKEMCVNCHDQAARFMYILSKGQMRDLTTDDFIPMVQDVVDTHPGLTFLKEATEFHSRYVHTVITRIFYCVNRSWSGHISLPELRRSDLLRVIRLLEEEEDINQVTAYFSYEHFYVIYCKFWELDRDHDLYIDRQDLARHSDHALSSRMIDRIFSGAVTRGGRLREDRMSYTEFVWFLLSEEDKTHPTAIEYWFRCMDLDGDGFLSMYELEYFYEEQLQRMEAIGIETLPFEDCLCQMLDMIRPAVPGKISLADLKRCKMTSIFFDTFFNLEKYLDHEQRDPFASQRDHDNDGQELSDWDRYAAEEYELLVAEEGGNDQQDDQLLDDEM